MIIFADKSHLNALLKIELECFANDCFKLSKENFIYHIKRQNIFIFLYENNTAGYILYIKYKNSIRIYSLAVSNKFKNMGIGKSLCEAVINYAKLNLKNSVFLEVRKSNINAINLYKKLGFVYHKYLKNYYYEEDGIKMKLDI